MNVEKNRQPAFRRFERGVNIHDLAGCGSIGHVSPTSHACPVHGAGAPAAFGDIFLRLGGHRRIGFMFTLRRVFQCRPPLAAGCFPFAAVRRTIAANVPGQPGFAKKLGKRETAKPSAIDTEFDWNGPIFHPGTSTRRQCGPARGQCRRRHAPGTRFGLCLQNSVRPISADIQTPDFGFPKFVATCSRMDPGDPYPPQDIGKSVKRKWKPLGNTNATFAAEACGSPPRRASPLDTTSFSLLAATKQVLPPST